MTEESHLKGQIDALREHVDSRFGGLERWIERMSTSVEKLNETIGKYANLESLVDLRLKSADERISNLKDRIEEIQASSHSRIENLMKTADTNNARLNERVARVELKIAYWSGGIFVAGAIVQVLLKKLGV